MTSALTSFYRSLTRHRLFAALNIGGLALGIAVFLLLILYVRFETGYDRVLPGWDKLYLIHEQYLRPGDPSEPNPNTMGGELDLLRADFPDLAATRINPSGVTVIHGGNVTGEKVMIVDPGFFGLFPFPVLAGDPERTLRRPDGLIVTETAARKYFGTSAAVGRTLTLVIGTTQYQYRVGAVLRDPPPNVTFKSDVYLPMVRSRFADSFFDHWGSTAVFTVVRLPDAAAARDFDRRLAGFLDRHAFRTGNIPKDQYRQFVRPLSALHLADPADQAIVTTLGLVGLLTLLIAIVNYVNLSTARAGLRAREVAVRKVLGGSRRALTVQFLIEAIATVALAGLIGLALAELALPVVNTLGGTALTIDYLGWDGILLPIVGLVLVVGALAGLYPALLLSGFRPAAVLASSRTPGGGRAGSRLRSGLVVGQFAIAIAFAIATVVMLVQTAHVASADIGFRRAGLIVVRSTADSAITPAQRAQLLDALRRTPGVTRAAIGLNAPGLQSTTNTDNLHRSEDPTRKSTISIVDTGEGYFETVGARLLAGRLFDRSRGEDNSDWRYAPGRSVDERVSNVVLNASAARKLGYASPAAAVGRMIDGMGPARVIGVIADMRFESPREPRRPTLYLWADQASWPMSAIARYTGDDPRPTLAAIEATWKRAAPTVPFDAVSAETSLYERFYKADSQRARLFTLGAGLAVLIGCLGLYGLAAFDTTRRIKEIGIRKALGASTRDVLRLLVARFLRPVLIANLIAWPLAWVAMQRWLSTFDDRIGLSPVYFLLASGVAALIAVATVIGQSWRVARAEPARALRYE